MEFLIFSDSHGRRRNLEVVIRRQVRQPDAVFFLGDGLSDTDDRMMGIPVIRVRGNCDWSIGGGQPVAEEEIVTFEGRRILLTHGHHQNAKSGIGGLIRAAVEKQADLVLYGHTHTPLLETIPAGTPTASGVTEKQIILFNPGSIAAGSFGTLTLTAQACLFSHGTL